MTGAKAASGGETVVGTLDEVRAAFPGLAVPAHIAAHGFWLKRTVWHGQPLVIVAGSNPHGALFGAFDLLRRIATGADLSHLDAIESPAMPIRWVDEWDNADGTSRARLRRPVDLLRGRQSSRRPEPAAAYARLLASVGINGCNVNNVNGAAPFLEPDMIKGLARIADAMRPWGVRLAISVDIASPQKIGGLKTFDPLDPAVKAWWAAKVNEIYQQIPDFAGIHGEGRFRRPARPRKLWPQPGRRRQRAGQRARAARRRGALSRLRLQQPSRLQRPESRPRARRLRHLSSARRPVRAQRDCADQIRPHRLPGRGAGIAALRRPAQDQRGHGTADHAGVSRPAAPPRVSRAAVEGETRLRSARGKPFDAGESKSSRARASISRSAA